MIVETGKVGQAGPLANSWYSNMTLHVGQANKLESQFLFMLQCIGRISFSQETSNLAPRVFY